MNPSRALALGAALSLACAACEPETRILSARGGLEGLPGAKGGFKPDAARNPTDAGASAWDPLLERFPSDPQDPRKAKDSDSSSLRRTSTDGRVTLLARSPGHVMFHLTQTLHNKEYDLLLDQVLSDRLKTEYRKRALDPRQAVDFLAAHEQDVARLIAAVPMGEQTPGVILEPLGGNAFRLRAPAAAAQDLRFTTFDVVVERGQFRLLMIQ